MHVTQAIPVRTTRAAGGLPRRVPAVDGLRGVLALIVVLDHALFEIGRATLGLAAIVSVAVFFVISGYVLTRSWDGRFGLFLARRFVRLWPVFALALSAGCLLAWRRPEPLEFFWIPWPRYDAYLVCPPLWSLFLEAWAALLMPAVVWSARGGAPRSLACLAACCLLAYLWAPQNGCLRAFTSYLVFFVAGAALWRRDFRSPLLEAWFPQWLGRISYSLYLTHWLVLRLVVRVAGPDFVLPCLPLVFAVAVLVWFGVERPSIALSRRLRAPLTA